MKFPSVAVVFFLATCACQFLTAAVSTPTLERSKGAAGPTATVSKLVEASTVESATSTQSVYTVLCARVSVPADWLVDAGIGGFPAFRPAQGQPDFRIIDGTSSQAPTLEQALNDLKRGTLGHRIRSIENWTVDGEPAVWATLEPHPEFRFVVMVIAPDCGGGRRALFIYTGGDNRETFESFLKRIRFIR